MRAKKRPLNRFICGFLVSPIALILILSVSQAFAESSYEGKSLALGFLYNQSTVNESLGEEGDLSTGASGFEASFIRTGKHGFIVVRYGIYAADWSEGDSSGAKGPDTTDQIYNAGLEFSGGKKISDWGPEGAGAIYLGVKLGMGGRGYRSYIYRNQDLYSAFSFSTGLAMAMARSFGDRTHLLVEISAPVLSLTGYNHSVENFQDGNGPSTMSVDYHDSFPGNFGHPGNLQAFAIRSSLDYDLYKRLFVSLGAQFEYSRDTRQVEVSFLTWGAFLRLGFTLI
ncbi:MAG: hypothetical protein OEZ04_01270 [Nitrospinota bacterium]|nr:hypothetical protein [Nitrospinota bacterium]